MGRNGASFMVIGLVVVALIGGLYLLGYLSPDIVMSATSNTFATDNEPHLGSDNAPVTIVTFEDFECPFCRRFNTQVEPRIISKYVKTGKVRIIWKDMPLHIHPWAMNAAIAMECVYRQSNDVFWKLKDKIYNQQDTISTGNAQSTIVNWATQQGLNKQKLNHCIAGQAAQREVQGDHTEGIVNSIPSTPTSFVNGKKVVGSQSWATIQTLVEQDLN